MSKVSSHIRTVSPTNNPNNEQFFSAAEALAHNGFVNLNAQYVPRMFGARAEHLRTYDIVERESDGVLFAVRGTNQDRTINISRFTGTIQDIE